MAKGYRMPLRWFLFLMIPTSIALGITGVIPDGLGFSCGMLALALVAAIDSSVPREGRAPRLLLRLASVRGARLFALGSAVVAAYHLIKPSVSPITGWAIGGAGLALMIVGGLLTEKGRSDARTA